MKRIIDYRKLMNINQDTDLKNLKTVYRDLMKEWHPDKFQNDDEQFKMAEMKSKHIIEAYHFLVSVSPETHSQHAEEYNQITASHGIDDFSYKGTTLRITFHGGSVYEYFGVPKSTFNKFLNSPIQARFARRHIFHSYLYRNVSKKSEVH